MATWQPNRPSQYNLLDEGNSFLSRAEDQLRGGDVESAKRLASRAFLILNGIDTVAYGEYFNASTGRPERIDFNDIRRRRNAALARSSTIMRR